MIYMFVNNIDCAILTPIQSNKESLNESICHFFNESDNVTGTLLKPNLIMNRP